MTPLDIVREFLLDHFIPNLFRAFAAIGSFLAFAIIGFLLGSEIGLYVSLLIWFVFMISLRDYCL